MNDLDFNDYPDDLLDGMYWSAYMCDEPPCLSQGMFDDDPAGEVL